MQRFALVACAVVCSWLIMTLSCVKSVQRSFPPLAQSSPASVQPAGSADMPEDNSLCFVCHLGFAENDSIAGHVSEGITCAHCHGKSMDHMNDESMMTPPDILYGRAEVKAMCIQCHNPEHENPRQVEAFVKRWAGQKRENGRNVTEDSICTDCHGLHTIARR